MKNIIQKIKKNILPIIISILAIFVAFGILTQEQADTIKTEVPKIIESVETIEGSFDHMQIEKKFI